MAGRLKIYVTIFLCALVFSAYGLNAYGQIKGTFHFEPPLTMLVLFVFLIGGGVFDISMKSIASIRSLLSDTTKDIKAIVVDEVTGSNPKFVDTPKVEDHTNG